MRTAAQDVQVLEPGDPDIDAMQAAVIAARNAYWKARDDKVSVEDETKLDQQIQALNSAFDAKHGLTELKAEITKAEDALFALNEAIEVAFDEAEEEDIF